MLIKRIAHVCIGSTDLAATEKFYTKGLGFTKHFDFIRNGKVIGFYLLVGDNTYVEVFTNDAMADEPKAPIKHFCLEVDDIEAVRKQLIGAGYEVTEKKLGADQSWQAWTSDPCGVRMEFHQYTEQSSQKLRTPCVL